MVRDRLSVLLAPILLALMSPSHVSAADIAGLQQMYDGAMLPDIAVATFSQTERLLPVRIVHRGGSPRPLPRRAEPFPKIRFEGHGRSFDLYDYLATNRVAGLLVLKDGKIALEDYELGVGPDTHWASFSMAKSVVSTLVGAAQADGLIASLDDPVVRYVPALQGSALRACPYSPASDNELRSGLERDLHRPEVRPAQGLGVANRGEDRGRAALHGFSFARRRARLDLELQYRRNLCARRGD